MRCEACRYDAVRSHQLQCARYIRRPHRAVPSFRRAVRCYRRRSRQTNPGNAKTVVKENCAFKQCDSGAGTTMWTIAKTHQTSGKSAILNPSVRISL
jgi:hypothetical protein